MKKAKLFLLALLVIFAGCSPESQIENDRERYAHYKYSGQDFLVRESNVVTYNLGNNINLLFDADYRELVMRYVSIKSAYEKEAHDPFSKQTNFHLNLMKDDIKAVQKEILNYKLSDEKVRTGGIWVYHRIEYKRYYGRSYRGPYDEEILSLYSSDGEHEIWSTELFSFNKKIFEEALSMIQMEIKKKSEFETGW